MGCEEALGSSSPHYLGWGQKQGKHTAKILEGALWTALVSHSYSVCINVPAPYPVDTLGKIHQGGEGLIVWAGRLSSMEPQCQSMPVETWLPGRMSSRSGYIISGITNKLKYITCIIPVGSLLWSYEGRANLSLIWEWENLNPGLPRSRAQVHPDSFSMALYCLSSEADPNTWAQAMSTGGSSWHWKFWPLLCLFPGRIEPLPLTLPSNHHRINPGHHQTFKLTIRKWHEREKNCFRR